MNIVKFAAALAFVAPFLGAAALVSSPAEASPVACASASVATYTAAGFSCSVGGVTFSDITINTTVTGSGLNSESVSLGNITPTTFTYNGQTEYGLTLNYTALAGAVGTASADIAWQYDVSGNLLNGVYLSETGSQFGIADTVVSENLSSGVNLKADDADPFAFASITPPVSTEYVIKDDNTFAFAGYAQSSAVTNAWQLTSVPEPASLAVLGVSLAGLGLARRRRTQA